jgi:acetyltransferase-like isoleucine patch superfamily enzyme
MPALQNLKLKIRRGETPPYRWLRKFLIGVMRSNLPLPAFLKPALRAWYEIHYALIVLVQRTIVYLYREPLFRSRCTSVGRNLNLYRELPYVEGHAEIHIGDDVTITGELSILTGRFLERPVLTIKDRVVIGGGTAISVNQEVVIEEDVMISTDCRVADNDGHPREARLRAAHAPLSSRDIRPVRIRRYAWIGNGAQIMKGVTIGEGAIIGANSVVISSIPDYCVAMGNPAEVYFRNIGRSAANRPAAATVPPSMASASAGENTREPLV